MQDDDDDDDLDLPENFDPEEDDKDSPPSVEKDHQYRLMEKRRAIEDRLAQMQLERETSDFDFDDIED
jgi:hypothetical protein